MNLDLNMSLGTALWIDTFAIMVATLVHSRALPGSHVRRVWGLFNQACVWIGVALWILVGVLDARNGHYFSSALAFGAAWLWWWLDTFEDYDDTWGNMAKRGLKRLAARLAPRQTAVASSY